MRPAGMLLLMVLLSGLGVAQRALAQAETPTPAPPSATPTGVQATVSTPVDTPGTASAQSTPTLPAAILAPLAGQALQGMVAVSGLISATRYTQAELAFAYHEHPTGTWFVLEQFPAQPGPFHLDWDTTAITDGEYDLRLLLSSAGGDPFSIEAAALRVRNYTPIETGTPIPLTLNATSLPGNTPLPSPTATTTTTPLPPTPTPFPPNPAQLTPRQIAASLGSGALAAFAFFALLQLYALLRRIR